MIELSVQLKLFFLLKYGHLFYLLSMTTNQNYKFDFTVAKIPLPISSYKMYMSLARPCLKYNTVLEIKCKCTLKEYNCVNIGKIESSKL